jgi:hypothetical protein
MAERYPPDAQLNDLSGTADAEQEVLFITTGQSPYYTSFYKMLYRLLDVARRAGDLRVYKDGDLTFGVRAGEFLNGDTPVSFEGASAQSLTDNATNYVYLTADGTLTVSTSGFPAASAVPHVPLATIVTADGEYAHEHVTDYRGRAFVQPAGGVAPGDLHDLLPSLNVTAGQESDDKRTITIQARDAAGNDLAERVLVRVWIATADYAAPSAEGNTVTVQTGTTYETETANAAYKLISDADGKVEIAVTISGAASRYVFAEIDGTVYSSGEVTWAA